MTAGRGGPSRVAVAMAARLGLDTVLGVAPTVHGLDRLPAGGMVVAFNHLSPVDPFLVAWLLAQAGHADPVVLLRDDVPHIPLVSRMLEAGVVRIDDDTPEDIDELGGDAFALASEQVGAGRSVVMAPERSVSPSLELMPLGLGAARLAVATGVPLVPVGLFGTHRLFDGDRFRLRRGLPVTVVVGHPVAVGDSARTATRLLHLDLEALYEQALDDHPGREEGEQGAPWWPARRGGDAPTLGAVIDARAAGEAVHGDVGEEDLVGAEVWADEPVADPVGEGDADVPTSTSLTAMTHDELLARYPRSHHRNAAQQGGHLRDLKAVLAFDQPGQPYVHHPRVHLDHHADGRITVHWETGQLTLASVDISASAVRVVVSGRLAAPHVHQGLIIVPAGTLTTLLGVPQDRPTPRADGAWEAVRSMHLRA